VVILLTMTFSCGKEDVTIQKNQPTQEYPSSSFSPTVLQSLIDEVQDSVMLPGWSDVASNAGVAQWRCAYVEVQTGNIYKVVVPYRNPNTDEIENLLIAFKIGGIWKVKFINRYYYLLMLDITEHLTNKYYYISLLKEFDKAEENCANPTGIQDEISVRTEDINIITEDGTHIIIDGNTGQMFIISGPGLSGCCNPNGWTGSVSTLWLGSTIWWTKNTGNTSGSGINSKEDHWFNRGWQYPDNSGGGGGGNSSTIPECQTQEYWSPIDPQIKKEYIKALSALINEFDVITCSQPNLTPAEQADCVSSGDLLCLGLDSDCIHIDNGQFDKNTFTECMGAVLHRLPCLNEAAEFINKYHLSVTIEELEIQAGGFEGNCNNQEEFEEYMFENEEYNWYHLDTDGGQDPQGSGAVWANHSPISPQTLPTWANFWNAYPKTVQGGLLYGADNIYLLAGGKVHQERVADTANGPPNLTDNTCALKVSIALNGAGVVIPYIFSDDNHNGIKDTYEQDITIEGSGGKYHFVRAEFIIKYMLEVFPETTPITAQDIANGATPASSFVNSHGIYAMTPKTPNTLGASGHADVFFISTKGNALCGAGCHWDKAEKIYLWHLQ